MQFNILLQNAKEAVPLLNLDFKFCKLYEEARKYTNLYLMLELC